MQKQQQSRWKSEVKVEGDAEQKADKRSVEKGKEMMGVETAFPSLPSRLKRTVVQAVSGSALLCS